jgi:hypothetical protein
MAVLIPVYLKNYGPTNFLYFCDIAAILTVFAIWMESPLLLSAALVGIFLPQLLWVVDFCVELCGGHLTRLTGYMFDPALPLFLRFLSFFHFWLPFLLVLLVWYVGYDRRGVILWTAVTWVTLTICYVYMPPASPSVDRDPSMPVNINYVFNIQGSEGPQTWMDPDLYFAFYLFALVLGIYVPTHLLFSRIMPERRI